MANNLGATGELLSEYGSEILLQLGPQMPNISRVQREYGGADGTVGSTTQIPFVELDGEASTRAVGGAVTPSDLYSFHRAVPKFQIVKSAKLDNYQEFLSKPRIMARAANLTARAIGRKCETMFLSLGNYLPFECGTVDGTSAFGSDADALSVARRILTDNGVPVTDELFFAINSTEAYNLRALQQLTDASKAGDSGTLRAGRPGQLFGFQPLESGLVQSMTLSTTTNWSTTPKVVGAHARGAVSLSVDGLGTGTILAGSAFYLGTSPNRYVTVEDATVTGNAATLSIFPALKEAILDNADLDPTEHSAAGSVNVAYHPTAFLVTTWTGEPWPAGSGVSSVVVTDRETNLAIRISLESRVTGSAGEAMSTTITADLVMAIAVVQPEAAVRVFGAV